MNMYIGFHKSNRKVGNAEAPIESYSPCKDIQNQIFKIEEVLKLTHCESPLVTSTLLCFRCHEFKDKVDPNTLCP